eukprot:12110512-Ditylum_brightwellii.AAC.1
MKEEFLKFGDEWRDDDEQLAQTKRSGRAKQDQHTVYISHINFTCKMHIAQKFENYTMATN